MNENASYGERTMQAPVAFGLRTAVLTALADATRRDAVLRCICLTFAVAMTTGCPANVKRDMLNGELVAADYWTEDPAILSAGLGFDGIIGIEGLDEDTVRDAGGSWYGSLACSNGTDPDDSMRTSAAESDGLEVLYDGPADHADGLPIVFSWPVATETMQHTDFEFTLTDGTTMVPASAGMYPNWELNERNTVVVFDDLGDRLSAADPDARYPVQLAIVDDGTPLMLVGPDGIEISAVGMTWTTDATPYDSGPKLVGAKLNWLDPEPLGEAGVYGLKSGDTMPNDEASLYEGRGDFRLRMLTSGGFSPDGVTGIRPDMFAEFFRIHAVGSDGEVVLLEETGVDYAVAGGTLNIVGMSDLGPPEDGKKVFYDDCYVEDRDNYIDIVIEGDEAAARNITHLEIPALDGGYRALYNPGGPGPEPFSGVVYTAPGPADLEPVVIALDDPMRIDRDPVD